MNRFIRNMKYDWYDADKEKLSVFHRSVFMAISLVARSAEMVSKFFDRIDFKVSNWSTHYLYDHSRRNDEPTDYKDLY